VAAGLAIDPSGTVSVTDQFNHRVRKLTPCGDIQLVAGNGTQAFSGDGGPAERASLNHPVVIEIVSDGILSIADAGHYRVRRISPDGIITNAAGNGQEGTGGDGGPALDATFRRPWDLAFGPDYALYVLDMDAGMIRRTDFTRGVIDNVAGVAGSGPCRRRRRSAQSGARRARGSRVRFRRELICSRAQRTHSGDWRKTLMALAGIIPALADPRSIRQCGDIASSAMRRPYDVDP
jgi:hypothetical protein